MHSFTPSIDSGRLEGFIQLPLKRFNGRHSIESVATLLELHAKYDELLGRLGLKLWREKICPAVAEQIKVLQRRNHDEQTEG